MKGRLLYLLIFVLILSITVFGFIGCNDPGNDPGTNPPGLPDVYIAGYTTNNSGIAVPAYWINGTRYDLSVLDSAKPGQAESIYVNGLFVLVAGSTVNGSDVEVPCYWVNGTRTDLDVFDPDKFGGAYSIFQSG